MDSQNTSERLLQKEHTAAKGNRDHIKITDLSSVTQALFKRKFSDNPMCFFNKTGISQFLGTSLIQSESGTKTYAGLSGGKKNHFSCVRCALVSIQAIHF